MIVKAQGTSGSGMASKTAYAVLLAGAVVAGSGLFQIYRNITTTESVFLGAFIVLFGTLLIAVGAVIAETSHDRESDSDSALQGTGPRIGLP